MRRRQAARGRPSRPVVPFRAAVAAAFGLVALPSVAAPGFAGGGQPEVLPRSVYVPVRFELASCLRDVVILTEDGRVRSPAPGRLVSQFTFYDGIEGASPEWERLTIRGVVKAEPDAPAAGGDAADRPFRAEVVITPASIYVADRKLDLGTLARLERFRYRTDLRVPERTLRLRPEGACRPEPAASVTAGGSPPEPRVRERRRRHRDGGR